MWPASYEQPYSWNFLQCSDEKQKALPLCCITLVQSINSNENLIKVITHLRQCELEILYLGLSILLSEFRVELSERCWKYRLLRSDLS